jgi:site-specific recombinase XerD
MDQGLWDHALIATLLGTGLRVSELFVGAREHQASNLRAAQISVYAWCE